MIPTAARPAACARCAAAALHPGRLAAFTPETQTANRDLKRFLHRHVYSSPALSEERSRTASMIAELFDFFLKHPERLPASHSDLIPAQPPHRVVCDYIAGMTDSFFLRTYQQVLQAPIPRPV